MTRRSLVAKSTPLGVVHLLTTLGGGPAQGVHIVPVVDVLAAPFQTGAILLPRLFPTLRARPLSTTLGPVAPCGAPWHDTPSDPQSQESPGHHAEGSTTASLNGEC